MNSIVPSNFRNLVARYYPGTFSSRRFAKLVTRLLFGMRCRETGLPLLTSRHMAADAGESHLYANNNFDAAGFLSVANDVVFNGKGFTWSDWSFKKGLGRTGMVDWHPQVADALRRLECDSSWMASDDLVYFVDGRRVSRKIEGQLLREERNLARRLRGFAECPEAREILDYLNSLPANSFRAAAYRARQLLLSAHQVPELLQLPKRSRLSQIRALRAIVECPVPVYSPSLRGCTARLFAGGMGLATLKSSIRGLVCAGWHEADLRNSQLAIVAALWDVPIVKEFLALGRSIWDDLLPFLGIFKGSANWKSTKSKCKEALYAAIYGMRLSALKHRLLVDLKPLGIKQPLRFLEHPVVAALLERREERIAELIDVGETTTCFGKRIVIATRKDACSALAQQAQAIELKIIHAAYELASETNDFKIVLHQHDGFSVSFRRRADLWKQRIGERIQQCAQSLGISLVLEWKETFGRQQIVVAQHYAKAHSSMSLGTRRFTGPRSTILAAKPIAIVHHCLYH